MGAGQGRRLLSGDASVLIDFLEVDRSVLALVSEHVGRLHVASPVLGEVVGLDAAECEPLGIVVVEPTTSQLGEAVAAQGALSFQDRLCLILARDGGMTCFTNDGPLRKACERLGIPTMRELRALLELVEVGRMSAAEAVTLAGRMAAVNPLHLTPSILATFNTQVGRLGAEADEA